jgi:hypothetical protein
MVMWLWKTPHLSRNAGDFPVIAKSEEVTSPTALSGTFWSLLTEEGRGQAQKTPEKNKSRSFSLLLFFTYKKLINT